MPEPEPWETYSMLCQSHTTKEKYTSTIKNLSIGENRLGIRKAPDPWDNPW